MFPIEVLQILTHIVKALEEQNILTKQVIDDQLKIHEDTINQQWRMLEKNNTFIADQNSSYHTFIAEQSRMNNEMNNEWYTPAKYVEAAREVFGGVIDLDPASCEQANKTIKAKHFYSIEDDGRSKEWRGNVFLNPPYSGKPHPLPLWTQKLRSEYASGNVGQAILLCTADVDEKWFQPMYDFPICFAVPKIYFVRPGMKSEKHIFGTAIVYLGPNKEKFVEVFSKHGTVVRRWR